MWEQWQHSLSSWLRISYLGLSTGSYGTQGGKAVLPISPSPAVLVGWTMEADTPSHPQKTRNAQDHDFISRKKKQWQETSGVGAWVGSKTMIQEILRLQMKF